LYKLKNSYIDKMVRSKLSSKEIDFILCVAMSQDDSGRIESVYYKDICSTINVSFQKFYDILNSLSAKGLLSYEKIHRADVCVKLLNNDFSVNQYGEGYLKVAGTDFQNEKFQNMKAGSKLLYLYMQRFVQGKRMLVRNFYEEFCRLFAVTQKSLQKYLRELKVNYFLFISKKRNKAMHYEMTMKNSTVLHNKKTYNLPTERDCYLDNIKNLIRRNFGKYLPGGEEGERILWNIALLAGAKRAEKYKDFVSLIVNAVRDSLQKQRREGRELPKLNAALVNMCLSSSLEYCAKMM